MRENPVKRTIRDGGVPVGLMLFELNTEGASRLADSAGADFVMWDMEHTGWTTETVRRLMAVARLGRAWPMVRVPRAHYHLIATALDAGAMGVMVPMVETAEEAALVVESVKYPPLGRRGYGAIYPDMTPDGPAGWIETSNRETMVIVQLETVKALENAEAIIGTAGVDIPWLGHFDLTASMGIPGQFDHPDYIEAVDRLLAAAAASNKPFGIMAASAAAACDALERGFRCIALGDLWLYQQAVTDALGAVRSAIAERVSR
jgi:2-dehydro-3-deoxyglucarate aldolase/4-hydroxy-2-oxoheptanedioate aldolase